MIAGRSVGVGSSLIARSRAFCASARLYRLLGASHDRALAPSRR